MVQILFTLVDFISSIVIPLAENKIGVDGAAAIAEAVKVNSSLRQLSIRGTFRLALVP